MPRAKPTPEQVWEDEITCFSLDTSVIQAAGYNFTQGALNQLPNQLPRSIGLQLSEIVLQEIVEHRLRPVRKAADELRSAAKEIARISGVAMSDLEKRFDEQDVAAKARRKFDAEVRAFAERCRGGILPLAGVDASRLFHDYFAAKPPFEQGKAKKSEFPDAAALQLLENYVRENRTLGIVVSGDGGWMDFCAASDFLYHLSSIDELAALFVATDAHAEEVKAKIGFLIGDKGSPLYAEIAGALERHVGDSEWDTSEIFASTGRRLDAEVYATDLKDVTFPGELEIWPSDEDGRAWIIEGTANVTVTVHVSAEFFAWDSIDREEISVGSCDSELEEEVEVEFFLTCSNVGLKTLPDSWSFDVEIAPGSYSLGSVELDMDYD